MFKSHRYLTAAVLVSCSCLLAPFYAHAEENVGVHITTNFGIEEINTPINISADEGIGVLVSAPGNTLDIKSDITASGTNGIAVKIDNTQPVESRNSADSYQPNKIENLNVSSTLKGSQASIYISENADVGQIKIMNGASLEGDIISYSSGFTDLKFGIKETDGDLSSQDSEFNLSYNNCIQGENSINMHIYGGNLEFNGTAEVQGIMIQGDSSLKTGGAILSGTGTYILTAKENGQRGSLFNDGTFDLGKGINKIYITGNYSQGGNAYLNVDFDTNGNADKLIIKDGSATLAGHLTLTPQVDYYYNGQIIALDPIISVDSGRTLTVYSVTPDINNISPVLVFTVAGDGTTIKANDKEYICDYSKTQYIINVKRKDQGYQSVATDDITSGIGSAIDIYTQKQNENPQLTISVDKQALLNTLDNPIVPSNLTGEDATAYAKKEINSNLKKLNPNVVSSQAQAVIETHTTLNNLVSVTSSLNTGSMSMNTPVSRRIGGLGPTRVEPPKYNSWRNIVIPFAGYTDQHNGSNGYTNHNSGVIGAIERTFANGLTHGYHAALNHQSTSDSGSTVKGEGLYFGAHASYAPADWNGWSLFGSARLGVEQMRSHRNVAILGAGGLYTGRVDGDWTGFSGSLNVGTALTKEHGVMQSGPFAALDYSFVHRPGTTETGAAYRAYLEGATYDSLRTQLGYRLVTKPKALDSYDSTQWQAHASVAWNHELLNDNGSTNYQMVEFPGSTIEDNVELYGRDSMSIAAGVIFKTPNRLDVGLTLGSDIYRKGGSSIYGKVNFEWKF